MELKLRASGAIVPLFTIKMAGFEPATLNFVFDYLHTS